MMEVILELIGGLTIIGIAIFLLCAAFSTAVKYCAKTEELQQKTKALRDDLEFNDKWQKTYNQEFRQDIRILQDKKK